MRQEGRVKGEELLLSERPAGGGEPRTISQHHFPSQRPPADTVQYLIPLIVIQKLSLGKGNVIDYHYRPARIDSTLPSSCP